MRDAFKPFSSVVCFSVIRRIHYQKIMNSLFFANNKCALPYLLTLSFCAIEVLFFPAWYNSSYLSFTIYVFPLYSFATPIRELMNSLVFVYWLF